MTQRKRIGLASVVVGALVLAGCGLRRDVELPPGAAGPAVPAGATRAPTSAELTSPSAQAQPSRSDEALLRSEVRQADPFDLPPTR